jgi:hypothetical protein
LHGRSPVLQARDRAPPQMPMAMRADCPKHQALGSTGLAPPDRCGENRSAGLSACHGQRTQSEPLPWRARSCAPHVMSFARRLHFFVRRIDRKGSRTLPHRAPAIKRLQHSTRARFCDVATMQRTGRDPWVGNGSERSLDDDCSARRGAGRHRREPAGYHAFAQPTLSIRAAIHQGTEADQAG